MTSMQLACLGPFSNGGKKMAPDQRIDKTLDLIADHIRIGRERRRCGGGEVCVQGAGRSIARMQPLRTSPTEE